MLQTLHLKFYKYAILTSMFYYKLFLRIFQNNVSLKNLAWLPLDEVYLFCKNASPKYVQNFAQNMWLM